MAETTGLHCVVKNLGFRDQDPDQYQMKAIAAPLAEDTGMPPDGYAGAPIRRWLCV
jgi:hypothetical protein